MLALLSGKLCWRESPEPGMHRREISASLAADRSPTSQVKEIRCIRVVECLNILCKYKFCQFFYPLSNIVQISVTHTGGLSGSLVTALQEDSVFRQSVAVVGLHYPCNHPSTEVMQLGLKYWASEGTTPACYLRTKSLLADVFPLRSFHQQGENGEWCSQAMSCVDNERCINVACEVLFLFIIYEVLLTFRYLEEDQYTAIQPFQLQLPDCKHFGFIVF